MKAQWLINLIGAVDNIKHFWRVIFIVLLSLVLVVCSIILKILVSDGGMNDRLGDLIISKIDEQDSVKLQKKRRLFELTSRVEDNINDLALELRIDLDADRVMVSTFHNGKQTSGGLDYSFMDEGYEKVCENRNINRILGYSSKNSRYSNIPTQSMNIYRFLRTSDDYFLGDLQAVRTIDTEYASRMESEGMYYCALMYIHDGDLPLSILSVSWKEKNVVCAPSPDKIRKNMYAYASEIKKNLLVSAFRD